MRWSDPIGYPSTAHAPKWAGAVPTVAFALLALALAAPSDAISLQAHTQVSDADFVVAGGFNDLLPSAMAAGRFNADNRSDLVLCSIENNSCWLYYGTKAIGAGKVLGLPDIVFVGPNGGFGSSVTFLGDVNGDGFEDLAVGAPNGTGVGGVLQGGSLWIFFGRGDDFHGQIGYYDANTTVFSTLAGDGLGFAAAPAGDVDRDGYGDFWVSAPNHAEGGQSVGAAYLIRGRASWPTEVNDSGAALRLVGASPGGSFGRVLLGDVDLDNDSRPDLLVSSALYRDFSGAQVGAAFAFVGPLATDGRTVSATRANLTFWGNTLVPTLGASLAFALDFTKEGGRIVFVGAPVYSNNTSTGGSVYLFRILSTACCQALNTWDAAGLIYTKDPNDQAGASMAAGADINRDGFPDLLVGAPYASVGGRPNAGRVFIVYGRDVSRQPLLLDNRSEGFEGKANRSFLGTFVRLADLNGDGWSDLVLSAHGEPFQNSQGGVVYGFVGRPRNRAPEVRIDIAGNLTEGSQITLTANVSDADNDRLSWIWSNVRDGQTHDNQRSIQVTYPDEGEWTITLTVFDGTLSNATTVTLTIQNAPPTCKLKPSGKFVEGQPGQVFLEVTDPGLDDQWTVHWEGPDGMSHTDDYAIYRPDRGGNFTIHVTAVDNDGAVGTCAFSTDIQNVAPSVTVIGPTLLYEGATALFTARIEDPGSGDAFAYRWIGPDGTGGGSSFLFQANRPGLFSVQLQVTDLDGGMGVANASVKVLNEFPDFSLIVPATAVEGDRINLSVSQESGFSYDVLTVSWFVSIQGYAEGMTYRVPQARPGEYNVEVLVFDDDGASVPRNQTLYITNRAPLSSVKVTPSAPYQEGQQVVFEPVVGPWETTPPSAIDFTWYLDGDAVGESRVYTFAARTGSHRVGVRAVDQDGGVTRLNFSIYVDNVPPVVRLTGDSSLNPGALGIWHANAADASGAPVELSWDVDGVQIAKGDELKWSTRSQGSHVVRVTADDGNGGITVASMVVTVAPPPAVSAGIDLRWIAVPLGAAAAFAAGILLGAYVVGRIRERRIGE